MGEEVAEFGGLRLDYSFTFDIFRKILEAIKCIIRIGYSPKCTGNMSTSENFLHLLQV